MEVESVLASPELETQSSTSSHRIWKDGDRLPHPGDVETVTHFGACLQCGQAQL